MHPIPQSVALRGEGSGDRASARISTAWRIAVAALSVTFLSHGLRATWVNYASITQISDFATYDEFARQWIKTGEFGFPTRGWLAYRTPAYPAFLASVYRIAGPDVDAAQMAQAFLGELTSGLIVVLASRFMNLLGATLAGLLHALSPTALAYTPVLASENLAAPVIILSLIALAWTTHSRRDEWLSGGLGGLLLGLAILVRPAALFLLPGYVVATLLRSGRFSSRIVVTGAMLTGTLAALSPWLVRNMAHGLGPCISTVGGVNLWMGNNPAAVDGGYLTPPEWYNAAPETERNARCQNMATAWMRANPARYLRLCAVRAARLLGFRPDWWAAAYLRPTPTADAGVLATMVRGEAAKFSEETIQAGKRIRAKNAKFLARLRVISVPLTMLAMALAIAHWRPYALILAPLLSYLALISATFVSERFRELANPLALILIGALLADFVVRRSPNLAPRHRRAKLGIAIALIATAAAVAAWDLDATWYSAPLATTAPH